MEPGPDEGGTPGRALLTFHTLAAAATGGRGASTFPARTGIRSLHLLRVSEPDPVPILSSYSVAKKP